MNSPLRLVSFMRLELLPSPRSSCCFYFSDCDAGSFCDFSFEGKKLSGECLRRAPSSTSRKRLKISVGDKTLSFADSGSSPSVAESAAVKALTTIGADIVMGKSMGRLSEATSPLFFVSRVSLTFFPSFL